MLAAVANCGRSQKWCSRGRSGLGFKPRSGSHAGSFGDHEVWAEKNHGLLFLFLRYGTQDWAEGEGLCIYGYSKGLWDLNEDIKLLLLNLYNSLNK